MKKIEFDLLNKFEEKLEQKPVQKALRRVLLTNELSNLFEKQEQRPKTQFRFSHEIKTLPVSNQKGSGRCWIFAGLNVLRETIAKKYNLVQFEFSQNYTAFWDKFEKINYFIESIDDFLEADQDDRTLQHILKTGIQDGGQWDMFVSLIEKYGVVPMDAMVETASSSNTRFMNQIINVKLRQYAAKARSLFANKQTKEIPLLKQQYLEELYTFLVTNFGLPPKQFDFEFVDKDGKYEIHKDLTPVKFYKDYLNDCLKDYISIINSPTNDKPFNKTYTISYLGNVVGGRDIKHLNLEINELKNLILEQLKNNEVVWFGADVARYGNRQSGVWDDETFAFDEMLEMNLWMSKADELDYSQGAMNHAMVFTGFNLENNVPNRYKIENSWGDANGNKGYYLTTDTWFDRYVYQAVINKKYLTKQQLEDWNKKPIVLKPWDPMGSLANK